MAAVQGCALPRAAAVPRPLGGGNKPVARKPERLSWPVAGARRPGALSKCVVPEQPRRGLLFWLRQQRGGPGRLLCHASSLLFAIGNGSCLGEGGGGPYCQPPLADPCCLILHCRSCEGNVYLQAVGPKG